MDAAPKHILKSYPIKKIPVMFYLGEDLVLVHGDESAQGEGGDGVHHDGVSGPVAEEGLVGPDLFDLRLRGTRLLQLCLHFL